MTINYAEMDNNFCFGVSFNELNPLKGYYGKGGSRLLAYNTRYHSLG
jgi:hypothetical protein